MLYKADRNTPTNKLLVPKNTDAKTVFLKESFNCKAVNPGKTKRDVTRIIPTTFIERTIVIATNTSKIVDINKTGIPISLEASSSNVIDNNSL